MRRKLFGSGSPDWYDLGNLESGTRQVIDNQDAVERLLRELTKALPLSALATPALMANLREQSFTANITLDCTSHQGPDATVRPTLPPPAAGAPETPGAVYQGVMTMARIDLILFALSLVTTGLPLGITYTLLLAR
jgi:hypothetical protein